MSDQIPEPQFQYGELWSEEVVRLVDEMVKDGLLEYVENGE